MSNSLGKKVRIEASCFAFICTALVLLIVVLGLLWVVKLLWVAVF